MGGGKSKRDTRGMGKYLDENQQMEGGKGREKKRIGYKNVRMC